MSPLAVEVWRGGAQGAFQSFEVPRYPSQTVLDVVTYIQRSLDATLAYRFACRVGMCGSCAMSVNGVPRWTCRTHVDKASRENKLVIGPLRNLPVIRDLVTDMRQFFDKWARAKGSFGGTKTKRDDFARDYRRLSPRLKAATDQPIIVYCSGGECHDSRLVANALLTLGFSDVRVYTGGWEEWQGAGLPTSAGAAQ